MRACVPFTIAAVVCFASQAHALTPSQCETLLTPGVSFARSMQGMLAAQEALPPYSAMTSTDLSNVSKEAAALDRARDPLIRAMRTYVTALEQMNARLDACMR